MPLITFSDEDFKAFNLDQDDPTMSITARGSIHCSKDKTNKGIKEGKDRFWGELRGKMEFKDGEDDFMLSGIWIGF